MFLNLNCMSHMQRISWRVTALYSTEKSLFLVGRASTVSILLIALRNVMFVTSPLFSGKNERNLCSFSLQVMTWRILAILYPQDRTTLLSLQLLQLGSTSVAAIRSRPEMRKETILKVHRLQADRPHMEALPHTCQLCCTFYADMSVHQFTVEKLGSLDASPCCYVIDRCIWMLLWLLTMLLVEFGSSIVCVEFGAVRLII